MKHQTDSDYLQHHAYGDARDLQLRQQIQSLYRVHSQSWRQWLFEQLELPENGRILELGCGAGSFWAQNAPHLPPHVDCCLSDLSPGMVTAARKRLSGLDASFSFAVLDGLALPFAADTFDVVLAFGVLDHLPDVSAGLAAVRRVLRPSGVFYAAAGDPAHLQQIDALVRPFLPEASYGGDAHRFGLQNGAQQLAPFFARVGQRPYLNELVFREPDPLLAYVLSEPEMRSRFTRAILTDFKAHVARTLAARGEVRVTVKKGLLIGAGRDGIEKR